MFMRILLFLEKIKKKGEFCTDLKQKCVACKVRKKGEFCTDLKQKCVACKVRKKGEFCTDLKQKCVACKVRKERRILHRPEAKMRCLQGKILTNKLLLVFYYCFLIYQCTFLVLESSK